MRIFTFSIGSLFFRDFSKIDSKLASDGAVFRRKEKELISKIAARPIKNKASLQLKAEISEADSGAIINTPKPSPKVATPRANPRPFVNHLEAVAITMANVAPVPTANIKL